MLPFILLYLLAVEETSLILLYGSLILLYGSLILLYNSLILLYGSLILSMVVWFSEVIPQNDTKVVLPEIDILVPK